VPQGNLAIVKKIEAEVRSQNTEVRIISKN